jgi:16S rRNA (guanine527-N7)-methyltransferase
MPEQNAPRAAHPEPLTPEGFAHAVPVSRETLARLKTFETLLVEWNTRQNLVSHNSLSDVWRRHFLDSAQLAPLIPESARTLVDLGTGAGFPGLVLAELYRNRLKVRLVEATAKKCRFLQEVAGRLELPVEVVNGRIEDLPRQAFDVVTARACAPLPRLLGHAQHFAGRTTTMLFLKGQNVEAELTDSSKSWRMNLIRHPSVTDPSARVLEVRELAHV